MRGIDLVSHCNQLRMSDRKIQKLRLYFLHLCVLTLVLTLRQIHCMFCWWSVKATDCQLLIVVNETVSSVVTLCVVRGTRERWEVSETVGQSDAAAQRWVQEIVAAHGNTIYRGSYRYCLFQSASFGCGASNMLGECLIEWLSTRFFRHGLSRQWRPQKKQNFAQR